MSYWKLVTLIETDDEDEVWTEDMIRARIMQDANRGDGMYMDAGDECLLTLIQPNGAQPKENICNRVDRAQELTKGSHLNFGEQPKEQEEG